MLSGNRTELHVVCHALCIKKAPSATDATPAKSKKPLLDEYWVPWGFSSVIRSGAVLDTLHLIRQVASDILDVMTTFSLFTSQTG